MFNNIFYKSGQKGFTLVELLIVIVVIAILAAIAINVYAGVQEQARVSKAGTDMSTLGKLITVAKQQSGQTMVALNGTGWSAGDCMGVDTRNLARTHPCWQRYDTLIDNLISHSLSSETTLEELRKGDPWDSPYTIDENEGESGIYCGPDTLVSAGSNGILYDFDSITIQLPLTSGC